MENSTFVTDSEITEYLNQELAELWSRLVQGSGQPYYVSSTTYNVVKPDPIGGTGINVLPSDFWVLQRVTATLNGATYTLSPYMPTEKAALDSSTSEGFLGTIQYRLAGANIEFAPITQNFTATVYYTPTCPRLSAGSDTTDGFNGYEVAAIYGTCATILDKEKADPSFYAGQKERIYRHIDSLASQRDMGMPERVQDVVNYDDSIWNGWLL